MAIGALAAIAFVVVLILLAIRRRPSVSGRTDLRFPIPPPHPEAPPLARPHDGPVRHEGERSQPLSESERSHAHALDPRRVVLDYEDTGHHETHRLVDIHGIRKIGPVTYLVAFCHLRNDVRTFRLDRVRGVARGDTGEIIDLKEWLPG